MTRDELKTLNDEIDNKINEIKKVYRAAKSAKPTRKNMDALDELAKRVLELMSAQNCARCIAECIEDAVQAEKRATWWETKLRDHLRDAEVVR